MHDADQTVGLDELVRLRRVLLALDRRNALLDELRAAEEELSSATVGAAEVLSRRALSPDVTDPGGSPRLCG